jgi:hypothetical protein
MHGTSRWTIRILRSPLCAREARRWGSAVAGPPRTTRGERASVGDRYGCRLRRQHKREAAHVSSKEIPGLNAPNPKDRVLQQPLASQP